MLLGTSVPTATAWTGKAIAGSNVADPETLCGRTLDARLNSGLLPDRTASTARMVSAGRL